MLIEYMQAAMQRATYEILPDGEGFYGQIEACPGVWANAPTLEACRDELFSALEGWIILGLRFGDELPILDEINLTPPLEPEAIEDGVSEAA